MASVRSYVVRVADGVYRLNKTKFAQFLKSMANKRNTDDLPLMGTELAMVDYDFTELPSEAEIADLLGKVERA